MPRTLTKQAKGKRHPVVDYAEIQRLFDGHPASKDLDGENLSSPFDLYSVETLRDRHGVRVGKPQTCDVFLWSTGEPTDRSLTKIGGLPYWPAERDWPHTDAGTPWRFLAQFNFSDSRDIVGGTPGDVLLIMYQESIHDVWEHDRLRFEWVKSFPGPALSAEEWETLAETKGPKWHGALVRTADYPEAFEGEPSVYDKLCELELSQPYLLPMIEGAKIGGVRSALQGHENLDGRFLCQLASIQASPNVPYPWLNLEESFTLEEAIRDDSNELVFADMGCLFCYLTEESVIDSMFMSY